MSLWSEADTAVAVLLGGSYKSLPTVSVSWASLSSLVSQNGKASRICLDLAGKTFREFSVTASQG